MIAIPVSFNNNKKNNTVSNICWSPVLSWITEKNLIGPNKADLSKV